MKKILVLAAMVAAMMVGRSDAQVLITNSAPAYSQDFDTLASSGTSSTVPTGWTFSEADSNANTTYTAGTGSSNSGDTYSFGSASSTDRALGALRSGSLISTLGVRFQVGTGSTNLTSLAVSYTGEQWRLGATGRNDRLDFQYSLNATSLGTGTWTDFNSLDFTAPINGGSTGALNGNNTFNRVAIGSTISGLNISAGSSIWFRWNDSDASGSDDGLAIDDFSVTGTFAAVPEPSALLLVGSIVGAGLLRRRRA